MEEFDSFQVYAVASGIRYAGGLVVGVLASYTEKKAEQSGDTSNQRRNLASLMGLIDGMRIPLAIVLAGEIVNPIEITARISLEYISSFAGLYTPKIIKDLITKNTSPRCDIK